MNGKQSKEKPTTRKAGRPSRYPWADWTNGNWWTIDPDKWSSDHATLRKALWAHAKRKGLNVETATTDGGELTFQFQRTK